MANEQDASIGINIKADDRSLDRIKQTFPEIERSVQRLKQTFTEMGTIASQRFSAFEQTIGKMGGGFTPQDLSKMRQGMQELRTLLRQHYRERLRLDEEYFAQQERLEGIRHRGRMGGLGRFDKRGLEAEREQHRFEMEWTRGERMRARHDQERWFDEMSGVLGGMGTRSLPPSGGGGGGGGGVGGLGRRLLGMAGRGIGGAARNVAGFAGSIGLPLSMGAAMYGALRQAQEDVSEYDLIRRIGTLDEQRPRDADAYIATKRRLFAPSYGPGEGYQPLWTYQEGARGMGTFAGRAGTEAARAQGLGAMRLGIGFGVGVQGGAEAFSGFARMGVTGGTEQSQQKFAQMLAQFIVEAQMRGREGEVFQRLQEYLELSARSSLNPANVMDYLAFQMRLVESAAPQQQQLIRAGAGQQIYGAVHQAIAGTQLFPGMGGQEMLQAMLFEQTFRQGGNMADMQERLQTNPMGFLKDILQHPFFQGGGPGGAGDIALSQMFNLPIQHIRLLRRNPEIATTMGEMPLELQGLMQGDVNPARMQMYMAAYKEYVAGPQTPERKQELEAKIRDISGKALTQPEIQQQAWAKTQNEIADLLTKLSPMITNLITGVGALTEAINAALKKLEFWFGKPDVPSIQVQGEPTSKDLARLTPKQLEEWYRLQGMTAPPAQVGEQGMLPPPGGPPALAPGGAPGPPSPAATPPVPPGTQVPKGAPTPPGATTLPVPPPAPGLAPGSTTVIPPGGGIGSLPPGAAIPRAAVPGPTFQGGRTLPTIPGLLGQAGWAGGFSLGTLGGMPGGGGGVALPGPSFGDQGLLGVPTLPGGSRGGGFPGGSAGAPWVAPPGSRGGGGAVSGPVAGTRIARPSALAIETYGQMIKAWSLATGYPEEVAWATLMGESGATTNVGQPAKVGSSGELGPMQLAPTKISGIRGVEKMSDPENVWAGLMHLKGKLDQYGLGPTGMTRYMGWTDEARERGQARWNAAMEWMANRGGHGHFGGAGGPVSSVTVTIPPVQFTLIDARTGQEVASATVQPRVTSGATDSDSPV